MKPDQLSRHLAEVYDRQYPLDLGKGEHLREVVESCLRQDGLVFDEGWVAALESNVRQEIRRQLLSRWLAVHEYADSVLGLHHERADVLHWGEIARA